MKRIFITTVSNQRNLSKCHYETEQANLTYDAETAYPIIHLMANNIAAEDDVELIAINFPDNPEANFDMLKDEIKKVEETHGVAVTITEIARGLDETDTEHISLFKELLRKIEDCSTIYADLTYGTKPTPMVISFALFWIELIRNYSKVDRLIYGRIFWKEELGDDGRKNVVIDKAKIYDVTEILKIINLTQKMEALGGENIEKAIFEMLEIGGEV